MHSNCAFCKTDPAAVHLPPPSAWTDYLGTERNLAPPTWSYRIPLCRDCGTDIGELKRDYLQRTQLEPSQAERVENASHTILDRLDLALMVDASPMV